jgi:hypothetical protein
MDTKHCAVDGWVDAIPVPGPRGTATFDLIVRPADVSAVDADLTDAEITAQDTPDTIVSCTSGDSRVAHELLNGVQPGDLLRDHQLFVDPYEADAVALLDAAVTGVST